MLFAVESPLAPVADGIWCGIIVSLTWSIFSKSNHIIPFHTFRLVLYILIAFSFQIMLSGIFQITAGKAQTKCWVHILLFDKFINENVADKIRQHKL